MVRRGCVYVLAEKGGRKDEGSAVSAERGDVEPIVVVLVNHPRTKLFSSGRKKTSLLASASLR